MTRGPIESRWSNLGIWFVAEPVDEDPDVERLLIDTARHLGSNPRLVDPVVTWLATNAALVAKHRLRALARHQLAPLAQARLALLLDAAIEVGGATEYRSCIAGSSPVAPPRPLFDSDASNPLYTEFARESSGTIPARWGLWASQPQLKPNVIRPIGWLLKRHPVLRDRLIRKGDLRASILEALRFDAKGLAPSESELARLTGATRAGVRKALQALVREGEVRVDCGSGPPHDKQITLTRAA
jgi:hypothetical protein